MKKLNKLVAILVAMAMMATLCVSMAFADEPTVAQVDNVKIKKTLTTNAGTAIPDAVFSFNIARNADKGNSAAPTIEDATTSYATDKNVIHTIDLDDIIEAALASAPNGQYAYDIDEDVANSTQNSSGNTYTYATTKYRVRVYKSGTADAPVYKYTVSVVTTTNGTETEAKQPASSTDDTTGATTTDLPFENKYVHSKIVDPDGGDPDDPNNPSNDPSGLFIQKNVGNDAAGLYNDKAFTFTLNAEAPTLNTLVGQKDGYSYEVVAVGGNGSALRTGKVVPGTAKTETLKTGERIVFTDLDVGATVTVAEADYTADFAPTATLDGTSVDTILTGTEATIKEAGTAIKVLNTSKNGTAPEGILISNLPYIALALVAIGGLVAYVVVRRRQDDEA